ncbi:hypothetical protein [Paenisporosarcina sp. OV554]|uniref:hypothetical protein n=1 Tax=Paenisporosarcina sp. OV554 TaxID=2135694 RepID=UPI001E5986DD|nr:hypothetical protein [Paenisporosarcina sp. OV554]
MKHVAAGKVDDSSKSEEVHLETISLEVRARNGSFIGGDAGYVQKVLIMTP